MKEYIVKPTREKGIYEVTDKTTNEKVDYTTSELLDEVAFELNEEKRQKNTGSSGYNSLELNICYGDDKKFSVSYNGNSSVKFTKMGKLRGYIKDKLTTLNNSPEVNVARKIIASVICLLFGFFLTVLGIASWLMQEVSESAAASETIEVTNWVEFNKQIVAWFCDNPDQIWNILKLCAGIFGCIVALFVISSSVYNHKLTILPLTIIKRKKKVARSEEGIAIAFLFFSATTVALSELVKKFVATLTDAEKFSSMLPGFFLGLAVIFLAIIYNLNPLADFLRYISGFIKFEQRETK